MVDWFHLLALELAGDTEVLQRVRPVTSPLLCRGDLPERGFGMTAGLSYTMLVSSRNAGVYIAEFLRRRGPLLH